MKSTDVGKPDDIAERITKATRFLKEQGVGSPDYALILGSGLGPLAEKIEMTHKIPYGQIPGFPVSTAPGHKGVLFFGEYGGRSLVIMQGRFHTYEGYSQQECTMAVAVFHQLGVHSLILTAATGGLNYNQKCGDLMLINDHINFTGTNPLIGPNDPNVGPRFPIMFDCYDPEYRALVKEVALKQNISLQEGVYCSINGPVFLTKAELRMLMMLGADSVGMSTVPEVIMARHRGLRVLGIAVISDMAIPDFGHHSDETEMLKVLGETSAVFQKLILQVLMRIEECQSSDRSVIG